MREPNAARVHMGNAHRHAPAANISARHTMRSGYCGVAAVSTPDIATPHAQSLVQRMTHAGCGHISLAAKPQCNATTARKCSYRETHQASPCQHARTTPHAAGTCTARRHAGRGVSPTRWPTTDRRAKTKAAATAASARAMRAGASVAPTTTVFVRTAPPSRAVAFTSGFTPHDRRSGMAASAAPPPFALPAAGPRD